ncbi:MAG: DnaJ domain-containing protein [Chloroflexota bacterium]|nr:DnaJ domain-containing protein [Chloroflexota bacterium]
MASRRFSAQKSTITRDLVNLMKKLNATSLKIAEHDLLGDDQSAKIIFDRDGTRYVSACNTYEHHLDNLRAAYWAIEYIYRAFEVYGVETESEKADELIRGLFGSLEAPLDPNILMLGDGSSQWFDVLGVKSDASPAAIINAYKALAKVHHPDHGGHKEDFIKLKKAYEEGIYIAQDGEKR